MFLFTPKNGRAREAKLVVISPNVLSRAESIPNPYFRLLHSCSRYMIPKNILVAGGRSLIYPARRLPLWLQIAIYPSFYPVSEGDDCRLHPATYIRPV
jgi:hypothetical protein